MHEQHKQENSVVESESEWAWGEGIALWPHAIFLPCPHSGLHSP